MEEQNKENFENQAPEEKEEVKEKVKEEAKEAKQSILSRIPKKAMIFGAIAVAVVTIAIVIIVLLAGNGKGNNNPTHTHSYGEWNITKEATVTEKGSKTRECSCGATETQEIPKKQAENTTLNATDCLNELNAIYLDSFSQKTVWFEEDGWIYARYFDGTESYAYFASEKDGVAKKEWYGKINGTYYYFQERITSSGNEKTYEAISGLEVSSAVENAGDGFQYLEYAISLIEEASTFSCQKTTDENGEKYILKLIVDGDYENITISVVNGLITVYDHEDYTKATYLYDKVITMPEVTDVNTTISATDCLNELNAIYLDSFSQKTVWFEEDGWIYARYFDGTESYAYFASEKDGVAKKEWYGKINGTYYYFQERITSSGNEKTYEAISGNDLASAVENAGDGFQYLEYAISLIEEASTVSCQKIVDGNSVKYVLKLNIDGDYENITISVVNGLITVYDHEDYTKATYLYDKVITMPTLTDFNIAN